MGHLKSKHSVPEREGSDVQDYSWRQTKFKVILKYRKRTGRIKSVRRIDTSIKTSVHKKTGGSMMAKIFDEEELDRKGK